MKAAERHLTLSVINLIFNGDWDTIDDFDEQLDRLTEYANTLRENTNEYNQQMMLD